MLCAGILARKSHALSWYPGILAFAHALCWYPGICACFELVSLHLRMRCAGILAFVHALSWYPCICACAVQITLRLRKRSAGFLSLAPLGFLYHGTGQALCRYPSINAFAMSVSGYY
jgi:hypothetical protein